MSEKEKSLQEKLQEKFQALLSEMTEQEAYLFLTFGEGMRAAAACPAQPEA